MHDRPHTYQLRIKVLLPFINRASVVKGWKHVGARQSTQPNRFVQVRAAKTKKKLQVFMNINQLTLQTT
jgi:hypothetical protein